MTSPGPGGDDDPSFSVDGIKIVLLLPRAGVEPAPRSHFEEFFGWRQPPPSPPPWPPRICCLRHSLFEAASPYAARPGARLEEVLDMLSSCARGRQSRVAFLFKKIKIKINKASKN